MEIGSKLTSDKAEKRAAKLAPALADGEQIHFMAICNNFRPLVDRIIVTNRRLLATGSADVAPKWETSHAQLVDIVSNPKKQTFAIHTADGREQVFKLVRFEDHEPLIRHLNAHRTGPLAGNGLPEDVRTELAESAAAVKAESAAPTYLQSQAIGEGFPEKHRQLVEPLMAFLDSAVEASSRGDILGEERAIWEGRQLSSKAGLFAVKGPQWYDQRVRERANRGDLRRGAELIGTVGANLTVMSDRVVQGGKAYVLDADVKASVELDGQVLQSTRPTLTRMAFGSVLPGSALLVGLAVPKTQTKDTRTAQFSLVHPKWRVVERLDPDNAHQLTGIAAQINAITESRQRRDVAAGAAMVPPPVPAPTAPAAAATGSLSDELVKLASLRDSGILTDDEFAAAKARLLG